MTSVQYVTDENGAPVAVQISIQDWKLIKAELEPYDGETETAEILADSEFLASIIRGREQIKQRLGKPLSEVSI
ncbi:MAG: hypothetical protein KKD21_06710 [Proteobacteria bacterium]|nr:hypothetical protein [Pseudomonadota bacterium]MBU1696723.1 hypothetical protein [Pseudomonadota bacterium]